MTNPKTTRETWASIYGGYGNSTAVLEGLLDVLAAYGELKQDPELSGSLDLSYDNDYHQLELTHKASGWTASDTKYVYTIGYPEDFWNQCGAFVAFLENTKRDMEAKHEKQKAIDAINERLKTAGISKAELRLLQQEGGFL